MSLHDVVEVESPRHACEASAMTNPPAASIGYSFGSMLYPNGGFYGPLKTAYATLLVLHDGEALIDMDGGERQRLVAGQAGCYLSLRDFGIHYPRGRSTRVSWCETPLPAGKRPPGLTGLPPASVTALTERLERLIGFGIDLGFSEATLTNHLRNALGEAAFCAHALEAGFGEKPMPSAAVLKARSHAEQHYVGPCELADLAAAAGVTPEYLVTAFRRQLGLTPMRYVWELRTRKAIDLVQRSSLGLAEIAEQCGYKSAYHLSRAIKELAGQSPRELRKTRGFLQSTLDSGLAEDVQF